MASVPFFTKDYGPVSYYCWVVAEDSKDLYSHILRFSLFYIPIWISLVIISFFNCKAYKIDRALTYKLDEKTKKKNKELYKKLFLFSFALLIYAIIATVHRVLNWVGYEDYEIPVSVYLHNAVAQSIGFIDSVVYGFFGDIRVIILNILCCNKYKKPFWEEDEEIDGRINSQQNIGITKRQLEMIEQRHKSITQNIATDQTSNTSSICNRDLSFISIDF